MMIRGANSDSIPMDLIPQILSRLPAKSVARFRCVSKPWESIICSQDFTELFRTMSSSKPRLLFRVEQSRSVDWKSSLIDGHHTRTKFRFYSSPQHQNHYEKSSLVVAADLHTKFSEDSPCHFSYASGLFYFTKVGHEDDDDDDAVRGICNPSTGQYAILPPIDMITTYRTGGGLFGFDPIGKQFKVLVPRKASVYYILTLGTEKLSWREIRCPSRYGPDQNSHGVCINGVLYYQISFDTIGYFDVRSEEFKIINLDLDVLDWFDNLINYKGKLCGIDPLQYSYCDGGFPLKLRMWVLEDVEKGEWSLHVYTLRAEDKTFKIDYDLSVVGVTASGEIVLMKEKVDKPFYVFYFNPETSTLLSVKIQGVREEEEDHSVCCFVDHVEDLNFDVMKTTYAATTSILPPEQSTSTSCREDPQVTTVAHLEQDRRTFETVNKFDALNLLEDD